MAVGAAKGKADGGSWPSLTNTPARLKTDGWEIARLTRLAVKADGGLWLVRHEADGR